MKWYSITDEPLKIYGLAVAEGMRFFRLPEEIAAQANETVAALCGDCAGGRVRFRTDSPKVCVRHVVTKLPLAMANMSCIARSGCDVYVDGRFAGGRADGLNLPDSSCLNAQVSKLPRMQDVDICLPMYNRIVSLEVGVEEGSRVEAPKPYAIEKPIVFYGSSITQGSAASRPGMSYVSQVTRALSADYVNLGFAGGARGEPVMAQYIAGLDMSLFVLDYDHNAPTPEHLKKTHYPFYETVRRAHPQVPILMLTRPNFHGNGTPAAQADSARRRDIVRETYERALAQGDGRVRFLDGETFFGAEDWDDCTADTAHPNDLGFRRMAQCILPVLREMLGL